MDGDKVFLVWHHHAPGDEFLKHIASSHKLAEEWVAELKPHDPLNYEIRPAVIDGKYEG